MLGECPDAAQVSASAVEEAKCDLNEMLSTLSSNLSDLTSFEESHQALFAERYADVQECLSERDAQLHIIREKGKQSNGVLRANMEALLSFSDQVLSSVKSESERVDKIEESTLMSFEGCASEIVKIGDCAVVEKV